MDIGIVERFLNKVDKDFPVPISCKQDLVLYARKLVEKATVCGEYQNEELISMVAGYTDNLENNLAYISIVATAPEGRGQGFATKLVKEFISICKDKHISAVHLYTDIRNQPAIKMYDKIGFVTYEMQDEPRPDDVHLIYYIEK